MKNKKLIYILIPAVALIWGLIIYKISNGLNNEEEESKHARTRKVEEQLSLSAEDTLTLIANYRDPFNTKIIKARSTIVYPISIAKPSQYIWSDVPANEVVQWPMIEYLGVIENKRTKSKVAMIHIGGKQYLMKEKELIDGIQLLKIETDSLLLLYSKEKKVFRKH